MNVRSIRCSVPVLPLLALLACAPAEQDAETEADTTPEAGVAPGAGTTVQAEAPDTTAAAVWAHLQEENYRDNWAMWPGKDRLYAGQEPHGMLLTTYLNPLALDAVTNRAGALPAGSIVVKENFAADSAFAAATVMYKAEGYDPEHNDWFWMKRNADGTVEAQGRVQMCIACHSAEGGGQNDYIRTGPIR